MGKTVGRITLLSTREGETHCPPPSVRFLPVIESLTDHMIHLQARSRSWNASVHEDVLPLQSRLFFFLLKQQRQQHRMSTSTTTPDSLRRSYDDSKRAKYLTAGVWRSAELI